MDGFIKSFLPMLKRLSQYLLEIIIISVALIITVIALVVFLKNNQSPEEKTASIPVSFHSQKVVNEGGSNKIFVDVSGAVQKPDVYQVAFGTRLKDVIDKAGGLSDQADTVFFHRNFNLARLVTDQEKIYVPSVLDISNGIFIENQRTLDYSLPVTAPADNVGQISPSNSQMIININDATLDELDQLPEIGQATANKIINNRPYTNIEELLTKKIISKNVYEKIKNLISL